MPPDLLALHSIRDPKGSHTSCISGHMKGEELRVMRVSEAARGLSAESGYAGEDWGTSPTQPSLCFPFPRSTYLSGVQNPARPKNRSKNQQTLLSTYCVPGSILSPSVL